MSWFNSLGKQAYSSHVSIHVNYPGSWSRLGVPQRCSPGLIAPAWNPMLDVNDTSNEECGVCVETIRAPLSSPWFGIMKQALYCYSNAGSLDSLPERLLSPRLHALNYGSDILNTILRITG